MLVNRLTINPFVMVHITKSNIENSDLTINGEVNYKSPYVLELPHVFKSMNRVLKTVINSFDEMKKLLELEPLMTGQYMFQLDGNSQLNNKDKFSAVYGFSFEDEMGVFGLVFLAIVTVGKMDLEDVELLM